MTHMTRSARLEGRLRAITNAADQVLHWTKPVFVFLFDTRREGDGTLHRHFSVESRRQQRQKDEGHRPPDSLKWGGEPWNGTSHLFCFVPQAVETSDANGSELEATLWMIDERDLPEFVGNWDELKHNWQVRRRQRSTYTAAIFVTTEDSVNFSAGMDRCVARPFPRGDVEPLPSGRDYFDRKK